MIIRHSYNINGVDFVTPSEATQQLGLMFHEKSKNNKTTYT